MTDVPDPPHGSRVRVEHRGETVVVTWPSAAVGGGHALRVTRLTMLVLALPFAAAAVTGLVGSLVVFLPHVALSLSRADFAAHCVRFLLCAAVLWIITRFIVSWRRFKPSERLVIEGDTLVVSPARAAAKHPYLAQEAWADQLSRLGEAARSAVPRGACAVVQRRDVRGVRLEGKGAFGIVSVKAVGNDVDMGRRLRDADREWLVDVIKRWKESPA